MIRRFRSRLVVILLGLVFGALTASLLAVWVATEQQVERSAAQELAVSDRVFRELLNSRSQLLLQAAQVLTDDFGFKRAVATGDQDTIVSALVNHGERIDTELMVLNAPNGEEIAATHSLQPAVVESAKAAQGRQLAVVEGQLFQLITVPVNAPQLIAWATLGFEVDSQLAAELKDLANADISIWLEPSKQLVASSLTATQQGQLEQQLSDSQQALKQWLVDNDFIGNSAVLETASANEVHVLLTSSQQEAIAQYTRLRWQIVWISVLALILAALIAVIVARSVSRPLSKLSEAAKQLQRGDYGELELEHRNDEFGQLAETFDSMRDGISDREQHISFQATHDQLTGLPNRRYFAEQLSEQLADGQSGRLLLLNIDQFRVLNDTLGQEVGDQVLQQIAERLQQVDRVDWVARVGGDEFALLTGVLTEPQYQQLLAELEQRMQRTYQAGATVLPVSFKVGSVSFPQDGDAFDMLLRRVQVSVQVAKQEQQFAQAYQAGMDEQHLRKLAILDCLTSAPEKGELNILLQPKIDCASGRTKGAEVLLRWHSEELGFVGPDEFIPLAEQTGFIKQLTRWVAEQSVAALEQLKDVAEPLTMSINLSAVDLLSDEILTLIDDLERRYPGLQQQLVLEVTESALVEDPEMAIQRLQWLRQRGYGVSIDDYGTGYSSLAQMRELPVTELKIDRAFVQPLADSSVDQSIVRSTIQLAHELQLQVVAEGVEDELSWQWLQQQQCDVLQGFYFSKPIPLSDFIQRLQGEANE